MLVVFRLLTAKLLLLWLWLFAAAAARGSPAAAKPPGGAHVAFVSGPTEGHVLPLLAIAGELRRRGHRVSLAVPEGYVDWVHTLVPPVTYIERLFGESFCQTVVAQSIPDRRS